MSILPTGSASQDFSTVEQLFRALYGIQDFQRSADYLLLQERLFSTAPGTSLPPPVPISTVAPPYSCTLSLEVQKAVAKRELEKLSQLLGYDLFATLADLPLEDVCILAFPALLVACYDKKEKNARFILELRTGALKIKEVTNVDALREMLELLIRRDWRKEKVSLLSHFRGWHTLYNIPEAVAQEYEKYCIAIDSALKLSACLDLPLREIAAKEVSSEENSMALNRICTLQTQLLCIIDPMLDALVESVRTKKLELERIKRAYEPIRRSPAFQKPACHLIRQVYQIYERWSRRLDYFLEDTASQRAKMRALCENLASQQTRGHAKTHLLIQTLAASSHKMQTLGSSLSRSLRDLIFWHALTVGVDCRTEGAKDFLCQSLRAIRDPLADSLQNFSNFFKRHSSLPEIEKEEKFSLSAEKLLSLFDTAIKDAILGTDQLKKSEKKLPKTAPSWVKSFLGALKTFVNQEIKTLIPIILAKKKEVHQVCSEIQYSSADSEASTDSRGLVTALCGSEEATAFILSRIEATHSDKIGAAKSFQIASEVLQVRVRGKQIRPENSPLLYKQLLEDMQAEILLQYAQISPSPQILLSEAKEQTKMLEQLRDEMQNLTVCSTACSSFFGPPIELLERQLPEQSIALDDWFLFSEEESAQRRLSPKSSPSRNSPETTMATSALEEEQKSSLQDFCQALRDKKEAHAYDQAYHLDHLLRVNELFPYAEEESRLLFASLMNHGYLCQEQAIRRHSGETGMHGLCRLLPFTNRPDLLPMVEENDYGTFWFRYPHKSRLFYHYVQRGDIPQALKAMHAEEAYPMAERLFTHAIELQIALEGKDAVETKPSTPKLEPLPLEPSLQRRVDFLQSVLQKCIQNLQPLQKNPSSEYRASLRDAIEHLERLQAGLRLLSKFPHQRYLSVHLRHCLLPVQYFVESIGYATSLQLGAPLLTHNLERYCDMLKINHTKHADALRLFNFKKSGDYPSNSSPATQTLLEGHQISQNEAMPPSSLTQYYQQMVSGLEKGIKLVDNIVELHYKEKLDNEPGDDK